MPRTTKKPQQVDPLAALCFEHRTTLTRAGRRLHDDIGPSLGAAGLKLQLLRMDMPQCADAADEAIELLDAAFEHVRALSQELLASPALRAGLRSALARFAEQHPEIELSDTSAAILTAEEAAAIYEVVTATVECAQRAGATSIRILVRGNRSLSVRISDNGRASGRRKALKVVTSLAACAQVQVEFGTKDGRIVLIRYGLRRPPRG